MNGVVYIRTGLMLLASAECTPNIVTCAAAALLTHLVLLLQEFVRVVLFVRDVDALEAVDVPGEAALPDVRLPALDGLEEGVVDEHVLLLGLDEVVPLPPDVLQVGEDVDVAAGRDLTHHGVEDDVAARPSHAGAGRINKAEDVLV